jgi:hypothetical protein
MLGAPTGILGAMMAVEVIREIAGFGEGLAGRLMLVDALGMPTSFFSGLFAGSRWGIVEQRTLTPSILVRIQVPQPHTPLIWTCIFSFRSRQKSPENSVL